MASVVAFLRHHIVMFGVVKFCAGLVIGFALGVYFLPILIVEKGLDLGRLRPCPTERCVMAHLFGFCRDQMGCIGVMV